MFWRWLKDKTKQPPREDDLRIAKEVYKRGELRHAVDHLAWALDHDPSNREALTLLDKIIAESPNPFALVPYRQPETPYPVIAIRAYILVQRGDLDKALDLMTQILAAVPGFPFLPWLKQWLSAYDNSVIQTQTMARLVGSISQKFVDESSIQYEPIAEELLVYFNRYRKAHPEAAEFASALSILIRKLGRMDEAIELAEQAYRTQPSYFTAVILGTGYRTKGNWQKALDLYHVALKYNPQDIEIRLDLGDTLCSKGRLVEGLAMYQEVLDREMDHAWAYPSYLYYKFCLEPERQWQTRLEAYATAHPDNMRAKEMRRRLLPYFSSLPEPTDATINALDQIFQKQSDNRILELGLSSLESPSTRLAVELFQRERFGEANFVVGVGQLQKPDPRRPQGSVDFILWTYTGTDPKPAIPPPSAEVADLVAGLAASPFQAEMWYWRAFPLAQQIGPQRLTDLLGVMLHPPPRPLQFAIWTWLFQVQVAAAFIIARLDDGWHGSVRRNALFSLAYGPMDWTVTASVVALGQLAFQEPETESDIGALYLKLLNSLPRPGHVPYEAALIYCGYGLPSPSPALRAKLDEMVNRSRANQ